MATADRAGPPGHLPLDLNRRFRFDRLTWDHMIVGPLVGLEDHPTRGWLSLDCPHRGRQDAGIVPTDPEENRTRGVWSNDNPNAFILVVVEGRGERPVHISHCTRLKEARRPPPTFVAPTAHRACPVVGPPSSRSHR